MGPAEGQVPLDAEKLWSQRSYALFNFSFSAITSFTLIFSLSLSHIALFLYRKVRKVSSYHLLCSSRIWVQVFFFFSFAEADSHFISLIISLSTTSHEGISNKYFLPFVVGSFFRSASYSPIFYIPSARYNNGSTINFCGTQRVT